MIRGLLPAAVAVHATAAAEEPTGELSRRLRFDQGRACARRALTDLGCADVEVGRGPQREPLWPPGFVGSITHVAGLSAVAVVSRAHLTAMGIDAEPNAPLPAGVEDLVVSDGVELSALDPSPDPRVSWPTVLFSAKESVYKAWYPVVGTWLDFRDIRVELSPVAPTAGELRVSPSPTKPLSASEARFVEALRGHYHADPTIGLVTTTAYVRAETSARRTGSPMATST